MVNGGFMHGRMLGDITKVTHEGNQAFEVWC
jgi:hypothetical protein